MNVEAVFGTFPVLESDRLILKKVEDRHAEQLLGIYSNDHVFEYCGILPKYKLDVIRKMIGHFERDYMKRSRVKWGIFEQEEAERLVGITEVMAFSQTVSMVTAGYFLAEESWRKGIATEALSMMVDYLFEKVGVNRIQAEVMPANESSKRVLLKNGFTREGLLRQAALWSGKGIVDLEIYGLLRAEHRGSSPYAD
ncbi:GNAT family N-acetyltransferase [Paenibacillus hexagrammi]|uniref:GNAT family N-acetyltransferase n=1 Tax=Paenibacillus hexagrammi TaxID=2908839 RepID=A0ABY3SFZ6_9BACL|nr:GNAT family protein [Paenibacillus sp. YPD9-1]UJF32121.1 GNAT family N-acetyltransferase [Paenibacillus sp. YPD9-1]